MKLFVIAVLVCGIGSPLRGADNDTTKGLLKGRFWVPMGGSTPAEHKGGMVAKWFWLLAVKDTLKDRAPQELASYIPESLNGAETSDALDAFYGVPENLPVPIIWALSVVSLRAKGGTAAEVDALTARCRKRAAE